MYSDCIQEVLSFMVAQSRAEPIKLGKKHPLLVYRFIGGRLRLWGVVLFLAGLIAKMPYFIPLLRFRNAILGYELLARLGLLAMIVGAVLWITSIYRVRRAYVQCFPDYVMINTAG